MKFFVILALTAINVLANQVANKGSSKNPWCGQSDCDAKQKKEVCGFDSSAKHYKFFSNICVMMVANCIENKNYIPHETKDCAAENLTHSAENGKSESLGKEVAPPKNSTQHKKQHNHKKHQKKVPDAKSPEKNVTEETSDEDDDDGVAIEKGDIAQKSILGSLGLGAGALGAGALGSLGAVALNPMTLLNLGKTAMDWFFGSTSQILGIKKQVIGLADDLTRGEGGEQKALTPFQKFKQRWENFMKSTMDFVQMAKKIFGVHFRGCLEVLKDPSGC